MEMHQVRYFLAVAEELNFTRAAERCHVSPPSLFRAIKLLETELGGLLFNRERSRTHLTELGRIALPYIQQIADSAELTKSETARALSLDHVTLNVGVMCTIAPGYFLDLITAFHCHHPHVTLTLIDGRADHLRTALLQGELDVAIYAEPGISSDDSLHRLPLFSEDMVIALSVDHELATIDPLHARSLAGIPYIERANCEFGEFGEKLFADGGADGPTICKSERDDWVLAMVSRGIGYAFLPFSCAQFPGVALRRMADLPVKRTVNIVTVRGRQHTHAVAAFLREVARIDWKAKGVEPVPFASEHEDLHEDVMD